MSVETVETSAAVAVETPTVERTPVTLRQLKNMYSNAAIRIADEHNPDDESLDKWGIVYSFREDTGGWGDGSWDNGRVRIYEIIERDNGNPDVGQVQDGWIDARRVMEIFGDRDYSYYFQYLKTLKSVGKFGAVYYDYLPREMRNLSQWPHGSNALFEVKAANAETKKATVRLFAYPESEGGFVELGEHEVTFDILSRADVFTVEYFQKHYGLAQDLIPMGAVYESVNTGDMYTVTGYKATKVLVKRTDEEGKVSGRASNINVSDLSEESKRYFKLGDSWNDYLRSQPTGEAADMLKELSKVTVTKALKHADSNGYCSETAVALASAGHSLPELRVKGTVTLNIDVSTKEYMVLRRLMGLAGDSNPDQVVADMFGNEETGVKPNMQLYKRIAGESGGKLPDIAAYGDTATFDLKSELVWKAPRIRK